jgi:hypothetical protein
MTGGGRREGAQREGRSRAKSPLALGELIPLTSKVGAQPPEQERSLSLRVGPLPARGFSAPLRRRDSPSCRRWSAS